MREFKASTKRGQAIIKMGDFLVGTKLSDIYTTYSSAKEKAFNWCYNEYLQSENHTAFGVGNANTFGFTASWLCTIDGEDCMRVETKDNSYLVWLER